MIVTKTVFTGPLVGDVAPTAEMIQFSKDNYERRSLRAVEIAGAEYQYLSHGATFEVDQERVLKVDTRYRTWPDRAAAEQWVTFMLEEGAESCTIEENA
jgi:hypothetical protein